MVWHVAAAGTCRTHRCIGFEVQEHFNDLVVATYGRGFWILDDITPFQQLGADDLEAENTLLPPRPAYRFRYKAPAFEQPNDPAAGANPAYGATIHLLVGAEGGDAEDAEEDGEDGDETRTSKIEVLDADGEVVRTLDDAPTDPGLHRLVWDLQTDRTPRVKLRTRPDENPHIGVSDEGWRRLSDGGRISLLVAPGTYTIRWTLDDTVLEQPLEVRKDPSSAGTEADIAEQMTILEDLRSMVAGAAEQINEIEWWRHQIDGLEDRLEDRRSADEDGAPTTEAGDTEEAGDLVDTILEQAAALDSELRDAEGVFFDLRLTGAGQDSLRWKRLLYAQLGYLTWFLGGSDFPPTDAQRAVFHELEAAYDATVETMAELRAAVDDFNRALREAGLDGLIGDSG